MKKKMLSAALLLAALMCLSAAATAEETAANEWRYSDVRKYLNNSVTNGQADSTTEECNSNSTNDSGYAAHFTDAEYALMLPTTVNTLKDVNNPYNLVTTTDRIFLPSGRTIHNEMNVLSWGQQDLVGVNVSNVSDKNVLIPLGYWAASDSGRLWLRSAGTDPNKAMSYRRTESVDQSQNVSIALGVAPVFTLNAENILFASCASAADLAGRTPQSIEIKKSEYLGNTTDRAEDNNSITSPTYGMYLKTAYEGKDFWVKNLSCSGDRLSFEYAGGMPGDYVMIQAYESDDFAPSENSPVRGYVAAMPITKTTVRGIMSVGMEELSTGHMADYTFKIWMENPSRVSLAQATLPQTFLFDGVSFKEVGDDGDLHKNLRMFAMKNELNCSWGDLSELSNSANIVAGRVNASGIDNDMWVEGKSCGVNPSNQIIYFGVESYFETGRGVVSKPLRFWIADHGAEKETIGDKEIWVDKLTLYQMSSDETHVFRKEPDNQTPANASLTFNPIIEQLKPGESPAITWSGYGNNPVLLVSTNPRVATVDKDNNKVNIHNYGEFSIVLFSGDQILHTRTFSVVNPELKDYDYTPAGDWKDDETEEDEEQPEQPEEAVQDAADGLPQTGDSSVILLWAALLALSLAGLAARRRRSA